MKKWWSGISDMQRAWIVASTLIIMVLGILSHDTWINILIGTVGMFYVSVYSTGTRGAFLLGVVYVSLYTVICLKNRIMLDAVQNIVLIPLYIYSFIRWGKQNTKPKNMDKSQAARILLLAVVVFLLLIGLSKLLNGNYSALDSLNTTCTLFAMFLGMYGMSLNWALWTVNNVASAIIFGLALLTPTGSITVFAMKVVFLINGLIGWRTFNKMAKQEELITGDNT